MTDDMVDLGYIGDHIMEHSPKCRFELPYRATSVEGEISTRIFDDDCRILNANGTCTPKHSVTTSVPRPNWVHEETPKTNQNGRQGPLRSEHGLAHTHRTTPSVELAKAERHTTTMPLSKAKFYTSRGEV